jgi:nucleotide-binding universal stress UspA family protein
MKEADMEIIEASTPITLKSILYLTDFSQASRAALPFAMTIARNYGGVVHALHVLGSKYHDCTSPTLRAALLSAEEEISQVEIGKLDSALAGTNHQAIVVRDEDIWRAVETAIKEHDVDLLVLGTRGRTGPPKHRLGSVAEEIVRRAPVPVLTIGPNVYSGSHYDARFSRVLFATDFEAESDAAVRFAISLAQENCAQLILLHVLDGPRPGLGSIVGPSVAEIMHGLYEMIPKAAEPWCRSEAVVKYGDPSKQIVETAKERCAELIVLGVRDHANTLDIATHMDKATAHKVLVHALCPVLTVRGLCSPQYVHAN